MIVHQESLVALGVELSVAVLIATLVSGAVARFPRPLFLALVIGVVALFLPALVAGMLLGRVAATGALAMAMAPVMAWGWWRMPPRQWRTARALGGSRLMVTRVLVAPSLAPFLLAAILLGVAVLSVRWRLDSHPALLMLPDPVTATG